MISLILKPLSGFNLYILANAMLRSAVTVKSVEIPFYLFIYFCPVYCLICSWIMKQPCVNSAPPSEQTQLTARIKLMESGITLTTAACPPPQRIRLW